MKRYLRDLALVAALLGLGAIVYVFALVPGAGQ